MFNDVIREEIERMDNEVFLENCNLILNYLNAIKFITESKSIKDEEKLESIKRELEILYEILGTRVKQKHQEFLENVKIQITYE